MGTLTPVQTDRLEELESEIETGLGHFVRVGELLLTIRDEKLYSETHETFAEYCRQRWGFTRQRAHQYIEAAEVVQTLEAPPEGMSTSVDKLPANEAVTRELAKVPKQKRSKAWKKAVAASGNGKVTARHVREAAEPHHKGGTLKSDPRLFKGLVDHLGKAARMIDHLSKSCPAPKFHRDSLQHLSNCLQAVKEWQQALR